MIIACLSSLRQAVFKYKVLLPPQSSLLITTVLENVGRFTYFLKTQVFKKYSHVQYLILAPSQVNSQLLSQDNLNVQRYIILALSAKLAVPDSRRLSLPAHSPSHYLKDC